MPIDFDDRELNGAISRVIKAISSTLPMYQDFSQAMQGDVFDHFRKQTGPSEKWLKSQRAKLQGGTTLRDTGRLINSILAKPKKEEAAVQTSIKYANIHNFGGVVKFKKRRGEIKMPERPFMWLSDEVKKNMVSIAGEYLTKAWSK